MYCISHELRTYSTSIFIGESSKGRLDFASKFLALVRRHYLEVAILEVDLGASVCDSDKEHRLVHLEGVVHGCHMSRGNRDVLVLISGVTELSETDSLRVSALISEYARASLVFICTGEECDIHTLQRGIESSKCYISQKEHTSAEYFALLDAETGEIVKTCWGFEE